MNFLISLIKPVANTHIPTFSQVENVLFFKYFNDNYDESDYIESQFYRERNLLNMLH